MLVAIKPFFIGAVAVFDFDQADIELCRLVGGERDRPRDVQRANDQGFWSQDVVCDDVPWQDSNFRASRRHAAPLPRCSFRPHPRTGAANDGDVCCILIGCIAATAGEQCRNNRQQRNNDSTRHEVSSGSEFHAGFAKGSWYRDLGRDASWSLIRGRRSLRYRTLAASPRRMSLPTLCGV